jgi:FkbM family methyltransferase
MNRAAGAVRRVRGAVGRRLELFTVDALELDLTPPGLARLEAARAGHGAEGPVVHRGTDPRDPVLIDALPASRLKLLAERTRRGDECHIVLLDGEAVGWLWFARRSHRDPWSGLKVHLDRGESYLYDLWIEPGRRRGGVAVTLAHSVLGALGAEGMHVGYCWVDQENVPSQRMVRDVLGFTDVQTIRYARVLDRFGMTVPFSARPSYGPFSRRSADRRARRVSPQSARGFAKSIARRLPVAPVRWWVRYAPLRLGKPPLVRGVLEPRLEARPREFVARTQWGGRFAGTTADVLDRYVYAFGVWEPNLTRWLSATLKPGDVFVDVGANVGYFSILASRIVGPSGSVVAIEASPTTFELLTANLARNHVTNVRAVNVAASDAPGTLRLFEGPAWNRGLANTTLARGGTSDVEVSALPLPTILSSAELQRARVVKIDVEGGEPAVMRGLLPQLGAMRDDAEFVLEILPGYFEKRGSTPEELLAPLRERGYAIRKLPLDYSPESHISPRVTEPIAWDGVFDPNADFIFSRAPAPRAKT